MPKAPEAYFSLLLAGAFFDFSTLRKLAIIGTILDLFGTVFVSVQVRVCGTKVLNTLIRGMLIDT